MATVAAPAPPRDYRAEFPVFRHSIYLNSCSLGALSLRSRTRVNDCLDLWEARGASAWYEIWWAALAELRLRYARLLGAPDGTIALHPNVSSTLAAVAESLDYRRRPKVVVTSLDFPTVAYQWLAKAVEGVEVVVVESVDGIGIPVEALARAVDDHTALVATSHVYYTSGAIQDIRAVAEITHREGALLLVDGYHAAGQLPVDVQALDTDFYCGGGLKWLLGGSGIAFLYARPELLSSLAPRTTGWFAHRDQFRFDPRTMELHDDARRLESGTPSMLSVYAQLGGLDIIEEIGPVGDPTQHDDAGGRPDRPGARGGTPAQGCSGCGNPQRDRDVAEPRPGARRSPALGGRHRRGCSARPRAPLTVLLQCRRRSSRGHRVSDP